MRRSIGWCCLAACHPRPASQPELEPPADTGSAHTGRTDPGGADSGAACPFLEAGTRHDLRLDHGGVERVYSVHVPDGLGCGAPVLVDLHGAYGGPEAEKAYALDEAIAAADALGFVLVRPRGLEFDVGGAIWTYWNVAGTLEQNADFLEALVEHLGGDEAFGPRWLMGYSSGADLTGWALSGLRPWDGFAIVAGASWSADVWTPVTGAPPRVYTQVGAKDDIEAHDEMIRALDAAGHPDSQRFVDGGGGGHRLARMHYDRAIPWLRDGARPSALPGGSSGWTVERWGQADLLALDGAGDAVRAAAADGRVWQDGAVVEQLPAPPSGLCGGVGVQLYGLVPVGGATVGPLPPSPTGFSYAVDVACDGQTVLAVGDRPYRSDDGGQTWVAEPGAASGLYGVDLAGAQAVAPGWYGGFSVRIGDAWQLRRVPGESDTWTYGSAVEPGRLWLAGEGGTVLRSDDGGAGFAVVATLSDLPLYAMDAVDGRVVTVGHDGQVWAWDGAAFQPLHLPVPESLTDVRLFGNEIVAVGLHGGVWRHPWP